MRTAPEHGDAHTFKITDHKVWIVARHTCMGKALKLIIGNGDAFNGARQMPQT